MQATRILQFRYIQSLQLRTNTLHFPHIFIIHNLLNLGAIPRTDATLFGQGIGPVFLYYVACRGLESRLLDCPNGGIELNTCSHYYDAGVTCLQGVYVNSQYLC